MKKLSAVIFSVVLVGSNMMFASGRYVPSVVGLSSAEAARGARVTRRGPRGSVTRSAVRGPRGVAARTTVRTPRGTATRGAVRTPRGGAARATVSTPHGTASRAVVRPGPVPVRPVPPVVRPVPVRPIPPPPARIHARAHYYDDYWDDDHYSGGTVLAAAVAGLAVGAMVASIPPSCSTIIRNGKEYKKCGDTYYEQTFNGSEVVYVVVPAP